MLFILLQGSIGVYQDIINISSDKYVQVLSEDHYTTVPRTTFFKDHHF